ncbi:MAG: hypothetical protein HDQ87_09525 [Clostridia bacterium]|nr:hypothetical protein [Clostridia bacterium]
MPDAWMLRNDGKLLPVPFHPFGGKDTDDYELELANLLFLYKDSNDPLICTTYINLAREWLLDSGLLTRADVESYPFDTSDPYCAALQTFLAAEADNILSSDSEDPDVALLLWDLTTDLNQLYCRARYGGKTNTTEGCTDLYFRLSSAAFDWLRVISSAVRGILQQKPETQTVTICRDKETSGTDAPVKDSRGHVYDKMPLQDFLDLEPEINAGRISLLPKVRPSSRSQEEAYDLLRSGMPVSRIRRSTQMDAVAFRDFLNSLRNEEVERTAVSGADLSSFPATASGHLPLETAGR